VPGTKGKFINIDDISHSLTRIQSDPMHPIVHVLHATGKEIAYYTAGAFNDDQFEPTDSTLLDLQLPADGTYYVQVGAYSAGDTGNYEMLVYTFDAGYTT